MSDIVAVLGSRPKYFLDLAAAGAVQVSAFSPVIPFEEKDLEGAKGLPDFLL